MIKATASIAVQDDKTCTVSIGADFECALVSGLTPEQAVQVKQALDIQFERGKWHQHWEINQALRSIEPKR